MSFIDIEFITIALIIFATGCLIITFYLIKHFNDLKKERYEGLDKQFHKDHLELQRNYENVTWKLGLCESYLADIKGIVASHRPTKLKTSLTEYFDMIEGKE